jgi:hypothetical protein
MKANRSNVTAQGKTNKKQQNRRKMYQFRLLTLKQLFPKKIYVMLQAGRSRVQDLMK